MVTALIISWVFAFCTLLVFGGYLIAERRAKKAERSRVDADHKAYIEVMQEAEKEIVAVRDHADCVEAQLKKVTNQKKSSEVRTGLIAEQMAPFLKEFPYDPQKTKFLGQPIDFVTFDDSGVHLVEVKSGKSQLSSTQRKIRDQIQEGSVTFEIYRIKGE